MQKRKIKIVKQGHKVNKRKWFGKCGYCDCEIVIEPRSTDTPKTKPIEMDCPTENCWSKITFRFVEADATGTKPEFD